MNRKIGAVLSYIYMIIEVLSTILLTPMIISSFGDAEYGVYKLVSSLTAYLLLLELGMGNSVIRYVAKYKENRDTRSCCNFVGVCIIFYVAVALIAFMLGVALTESFGAVFAKGLSKDEILLSEKLLRLTILNVVITLGTSVFYNVIIAYSKFSVSKGSLIIQIIFRFILTILALKLGYRSIAVVGINLILTIVFRGFYIVYVLFVIKLRPKFKGIDFSFIKDIVGYSFFILLQMVATQINCYVDQALLGMLVPAASVIIAVYGVGTQIVQYFQSIGQALGGILMPGVVKMVEGGATPQKLQNEMIRIGRYSFAILGMIFAGFLINGETFLSIWIGEGYNQSYFVALMLMFAHLFILTENIGTQILWAKNKHKRQSVIKFAVVLVNIVLTVFLIKWKPLIGATIGTFISLIFGDVVCMNIVFKKEVGISLKEYYSGLFHGIVPCLVASGLCGFLVSRLNISGLVGFIVNVLAMLIVYAITMWIYGFNKDEKAMISSLYRKVLRLNK